MQPVFLHLPLDTHLPRALLAGLCLLLISTTVWAANAPEEITVEVLDTDLYLQRFHAEGEHLIVWVSPGFGNHDRAYDVARALTRHDIEVWHIDLAESLFLTQGTNTLRALDGRYVAGLIAAAHRLSGKSVTLMTRSYAALPVLRGARLWQQQAAEAGEDYLTGAILFSPELYSEIPPLGQPPVYDPIASSTNIPIMLFQAGKRGNRWQLDNTLDQLQSGGAAVYLKILPGVTGVFYIKDTTAETTAVLKQLPAEIERVVTMLKRVPTPKTVRPLPATRTPDQPGLDITLQPFRSSMTPLEIDLYQVSGERFTRKDFTGQVTVVNFWASWCGPCVEEIPALNRLRGTMKGKPFELVSINYAETPEQINEFLNMVKVDFPVLLDQDGSYSAQWNVLVYPATFVIGADGKIAYGVNGAIEWDNPEVTGKLQALMQQ
ncbi:MAG: TlpA family protein disulfide reductase [Thiotrichales bacterium]|nr:MAG: TlpA family protein disulfide reductase [Thiotrichales bacterium]